MAVISCDLEQQYGLVQFCQRQAVYLVAKNSEVLYGL